MMIKTDSGYLDFSGSVELERHVKLFEEIDKTQGDFSYQFDLPKTQKNFNYLGLPFPDNATKVVYNKINAELISPSGEALYRGYLRVEYIEDLIYCSFFSGNNNWLSAITGKVTDLDFSEYDTELNNTNINNSFADTSGLIFPLIDAGGLVTRRNENLGVEDFVGAMYVKTIFQKIFNAAGIKLKGELLQDWVYNHAIIVKNNKTEQEINANSCFVQKTTTTARPVELDFYKLTFDNDSTYPYFDGENDNFDLANSKFVAPVKMRVRVDVVMEPSIKDTSYANYLRLYINGAYPGFVDIGMNSGEGGLYNNGTVTDEDTHTLSRTITLNAGDELEVYSAWQQSTGSTQNDILSGSIRITPIFIYTVYGNACVPDWEQIDFVTNYLKLFNTITDFDPVSKELTVNFFDKIKTKPAIDLSPYLKVQRTDYINFVQNYGQTNTLAYQESEDIELRDFGVKRFFKYTSGEITTDNDFLAGSAELISSDFKSPTTYINDAMGCSIERLPILNIDTGNSTEITSVTDSSGVARFNISKNLFLAGDLVRIENASNPSYNGDFIVDNVATGYIELRHYLSQNVVFLTDADGDISKLDYTYTDTDDVYLLINIPNVDILDFSEKPALYIGGTAYGGFAYPYFSLINTGKNINEYTQSLSFQRIADPLFYQRTLVDSYWGVVEDVLNDPVMLPCVGYIPEKVYRDLSPLSPVYLKTQETVNLYYVNRITGYKGGSMPCEVELIKLP